MSSNARLPAGEHGPQGNRVTTDTRERGDVDGEVVPRLAVPPRLLVEHRGDERGGLRRARPPPLPSLMPRVSHHSQSCKCRASHVAGRVAEHLVESQPSG